MAKEKGKRKAGELSQMERAIMAASNYQGMRSQESCRDFMMAVKANYKAILKDFNFDGKPSDSVPETRNNAKLLASMRGKEDESSHIKREHGARLSCCFGTVRAGQGRALAQLVGDEVGFHAERAEAFMKPIVLEWEKNEVVYQHDQDTGERLLEKDQGHTQ